MNDLYAKSIKRMLERRARLQKAYDDLVCEPASYGITGSVSATNRRLDELRTEISVLDEQIKAMIARIGGLPGISINVPSYRWGDIPLWGSELYDREVQE